MDLKRIEDIERKLRRLREEDARDKDERLLYPTASSEKERLIQYFEHKDIQDEEEEPETLLPSRYMKPTFKSEQEEYSDAERNSQEYQASQEEEEEEEAESEDEDPREKLRKRLEEIRSRKEKLGPPGRIVQNSIPQSSSRPSTSKPRPTTAKSTASFKPKTSRVIPSTPSYKAPPAPAKLKKSDPVSLFHQRQQEWNRSSFLRANKEQNRQGRKLNLNPSQFRKDFEPIKSTSIHDYIKNDYVAPHLKRRDDLRFSTRMKMMERPGSARV